MSDSVGYSEALHFFSSCFFFNDTATTEIYTLSLHDALPISWRAQRAASRVTSTNSFTSGARRSEEHTSELQSRLHLVCRLLLEKTNKNDEAASRISEQIILQTYIGSQAEA